MTENIEQSDIRVISDDELDDLAAVVGGAVMQTQMRFGNAILKIGADTMGHGLWWITD